MRFGLVIYGSLDTVSGGYLYDRMLVTHLLARGDSVEIVSLPPGNPWLSVRDNFSRPLYERFMNGRWDILLQDELNHPSLFILNARIRNAVPYPLVAIVHHLKAQEPSAVWARPFLRSMEKNYLDSVDACVCSSNATRVSVEMAAGRPMPYLVAHPGGDGPCGVRPDAAEKQRPGAELRILFLGNVIRRKGLHVLLQALSLLGDRRWRLLVAGDLSKDPAYAERMRRESVRNGNADRITFTGPLSDDDLRCAFRTSHILAVPSLYEGFGIAYLEALGYGLPVIATTAGGACEVVTHGREGFLVRPGDAQALAAAIRKFCRSPGLLRSMSERAVERHRSFPTWSESMEKVRNFLYCMVNKERP